MSKSVAWLLLWVASDWEGTPVGGSLPWIVSVWEDSVGCPLFWVVESEAPVVLGEFESIFSVVGWFVF